MNDTDDWFKVDSINDYSWKILEGTSYGMYLLDGNDRSLVIDAGAGVGDLRGLVEDLADSPPTMFITHSHWDHIGAVSQFDDIIVDERELGPDGEITLNSPYDMFDMRPGQFIDDWLAEGRELPDNFDPDEYEIPPADKDAIRIVEPGDVIDLGGIELELFDVAGHTPGQLAALDRDASILYGSDVVHTNKGLYLQFEHGDIHTCIDTFDRLIDLYEDDAFDVLMTSHNDPIRGDDVELIYDLHEGLEEIIAGEGDFELVDTEWGTFRQYDVAGCPVVTKRDVS